MRVEIIEAQAADRQVLANLLELYRYDFTEFDDEDIGDDGRFGYRYLDSYWSAEGRHAFVIRAGGKLAGFVLLRQTRSAAGGLAMDVSEFFVMRRYRRQGVGEDVARHIFDRFPGKWEVRELERNLPAQAFWRRVIDRYTGGRFEDGGWDDGQARGSVQMFDNGGHGS